MTTVTAKRLLVASLAVNVIAVVVIVGLNGSELAARFRHEPELKAGLAQAPAIPYRAERRLSMTRVAGGLSKEELERWRRDVLAELRELLDLPRVPSDLKPEWEPQQSGTTAYTLARTTFRSPSGFDRIVMYRLLPTRSPAPNEKPAAVLAIPGTGVRALDGLLGRVHDYQRSAAERLAEHGYAVYAAESFGTGERGFDPGWLGERGYHSQHVAGMYGLYSGQYLAQTLLVDLAAELSVIRADPAVDGDQIATFGISRGSELSMLAAALNAEVKGAVVASGFRDSDIYAATFFDHVLIPSEGRYFLRSDVAGTIAPRPMLITYGKRFSGEGPVFGEAYELQEEVQSLRTAKRTRSIYRMFGAASKLTAVLHPRGHTWDETATYAFLRQLFGY